MVDDGLITLRAHARIDAALSRDLGVLDAADGRAAVALGAQGALLEHPGELAVLDREFLTPQRGAVCDGDHTHAVFRHVDGVHRQLVGAAVVDLDRGIAAGHAQLAVAGADDGAGQVDAARRGLDFIENDQLLVDIEKAVDRGQAVDPKRDARADIALGVGEIDRGGGRKVFGNVQLNRVHTALHQTIDVQVAGIDVDGAHREHDGLAVLLVIGRHAVVARVERTAGRYLEEIKARTGHIKVQGLAAADHARSTHGDLVGVHQLHAPAAAAWRQIHGHTHAPGIGHLELVKVHVGGTGKPCDDLAAI